MEAIIPPKTQSFTVFKTVRLSKNNTVDNIRRKLIEANVVVHPLADDMLKAADFSDEWDHPDVTVTRMPLSHLGFVQGVSLRDIFSRAQSSGLRLCPAEVVPHLRLQYLDQPRGDWLRVGMKPVVTADGSQMIFGVGNGRHGVCLDGYSGRPDYIWQPETEWVFTL